ncbi:MAG: hypothetical protein DWP95_04145 [Proteobacteria bacterium]|nr:MAG: hypothetical protein DWP95_04145 [Pseudomonadota bacterium]
MKSIFSSQLAQLSTIEVMDATNLAGDLFRRSFNAEIPDFPKHFVFLATIEPGISLTLGYLHYTRKNSIYLCGGMCVNSRALRLLSKEQRADIKQQDGVAMMMATSSLQQLTNHEAVFAHVGHTGSYRICMAKNFIATPYAHLIVNWQEPITEQRKQQLIEQANQYVPF